MSEKVNDMSLLKYLDKIGVDFGALSGSRLALIRTIKEKHGTMQEELEKQVQELKEAFLIRVQQLNCTVCEANLESDYSHDEECKYFKIEYDIIKGAGE